VESELMPVQVNAPAAEADAFHFQQQPLLERVLTWHTDSASCADYAMPRQSVERVESSNDLSRSSWKSGRGGDLSIGGDVSAGNFPDLVREYD
jgi:hypothetical protein